MDRLVIWMLPKLVRLALIMAYYLLRLIVTACYVTGLVLVTLTESGGYLDSVYSTTTNHTRAFTSASAHFARAIQRAPYAYVNKLARLFRS